MLRITIPGIELFDEATGTFSENKSYNITLEHSLVSISKWESKWKKPFLVKEQRSTEEALDYIRCMTITQNIPDEAYTRLTSENIEAITKYIEDPMTATTITRSSQQQKSARKEIMTSELIYYSMTALNIPMECQKWHLNRLLMLIEVCNIKNMPKEKVNKRDVMARNKALNTSRKQAMNTRG